MNKEWVGFHLEQAIEVLTAVKHRIESDTLDSMEDVDLGNAIAEAWGHLNAAWRGRADPVLSPKTLGSLSDADFAALRDVVDDLRPI
jgi:hypothetical protein